MAPDRKTRARRIPAALTPLALMALTAACDTPLDLDLRDLGNGLDTSAAAVNAAARPEPDSRGVLSYPTYQMAVASRGDTPATIAGRLGVDAAELARYNGLQPGDTLRAGELIALPVRVAAAPAAESRAPVDIEETAAAAISPGTVETQPLPRGPGAASSETAPVRHQVAAAETAFTIARRYDVSVRALADWNGLGPEFAVREGQYLLIPVPGVQPATITPANEPRTVTVRAPGAGSPTPVPPSASSPLPRERPAAPAVVAAAPVVAAPVPSVPVPAPAPAPAAQPLPPAEETAEGQLAYPVRGKIIREYAKGRWDGIDIAASAGTPVRAAEAGTVAAITKSADGTPIIVIKHDGNLLTVYTNLDKLSVEKGDTVSRGQSIAVIPQGSPSYMHFEVRKGIDSVDPIPYLE